VRVIDDYVSYWQFNWNGKDSSTNSYDFTTGMYYDTNSVVGMRRDSGVIRLLLIRGPGN